MQCTYLLVYRHSDGDGWLLCGCDSSFSMENVYIRCDYIHCRKVLFFVVVFCMVLPGMTQLTRVRTYIHCKKV